MATMTSLEKREWLIQQTVLQSSIENLTHYINTERTERPGARVEIQEAKLSVHTQLAAMINAHLAITPVVDPPKEAPVAQAAPVVAPPAAEVKKEETPASTPATAPTK